MLIIGNLDIYKWGGGKEKTLKLNQINYGGSNPAFSNYPARHTWKSRAYIKTAYRKEQIKPLSKGLKVLYESMRVLNKSESSFKTSVDNHYTVLISLKNNGYKPNNFRSGYIKVNKKNILMDGSHRLRILSAIHKPDYEIKVYQIGWVSNVFCFIFMIISLIIAGIIALIKRSLKLLKKLLKLPFWCAKKIKNLVLNR